MPMTKRFLLALLFALIGAPAFAQAIDSNGQFVNRVSAFGAYNPPFGTTFTPSSSAYTAGYSFGGVQTITGQPPAGTFQNALVTLSSGTFAGTLDLYVFGSAPGTYADNASVALSTADQAKLLGVIHMTDVTTLSTTATAVQALNTSITYNTGSTAPTVTLYTLMIIRGTAPTFAASSTANETVSIIR